MSRAGEPMSRVGEVLIHEGAVSSVGLQRALRFQRYGGRGLRLGTILVGWNLADEEVILRALSEHHRRPAVPWSDLARAAPETIALLPAAIAEQVRAIPYREELRGVIVAFSNPSDLTAVDRVAQVMKRRVIPAVALEIRILQAQALFYGTGIPPDHRPILFRLRDEAEKPQPPRHPTSAGRVISIFSPPAESVPVEELAEESFQETALERARREAFTQEAEPSRDVLPASSEDQTRPIAVLPPRVPAATRAESSDPAAGLWLDGDTAAAEQEEEEQLLEEPTDIETPATLAVAPVGPTPRPGREKVARAVLDALLRDMPRTLVFGADKDHLFGVYARGGGVSSRDVQQIHLPPADGSILQRVCESRSPHFGRPVEEFWPASLAVLLGLEPPPCAVFPLESMNGFVGLLYADRDGGRMLAGDFDDLTRAAAFLANALGSSSREN